jgi:hypothetical protein
MYHIKKIQNLSKYILYDTKHAYKNRYENS